MHQHDERSGTDVVDAPREADEEDGCHMVDYLLLEVLKHENQPFYLIHASTGFETCCAQDFHSADARRAKFKHMRSVSYARATTVQCPLTHTHTCQMPDARTDHTGRGQNEFSCFAPSQSPSRVICGICFDFSDLLTLRLTSEATLKSREP